MRIERIRGATAWTWLDRTERAIVVGASILVLPVSLLLFLQWPLRDWLQAYSREANDLAQILFAIYVGVAITAATRAHAHLAADNAARRLGSRTRRILTRVAAGAVLLPWSAFVLYAGFGSLVQSVGQLEGFPETFNPGYFLIRIALALLALLVLLRALRDMLAPTLSDE
jgi:TRAP-type C4-dicarboxylate transport system permease small subunit